MVRESGVSNWKGCRIQVNNTWDLNTFEECLSDYYDKKVIEVTSDLDGCSMLRILHKALKSPKIKEEPERILKKSRPT